MSELAVFLYGHLPKGFFKEPLNVRVRVHNNNSLKSFQMQSGRKYPTRVLPECAKHLSDRLFAHPHVRKEHLK